MSRQATDAAETRADGAVGTFEVDFSGTLYEGINYVVAPGSSTRLAPSLLSPLVIFEVGELRARAMAARARARSAQVMSVS